MTRVYVRVPLEDRFWKNVRKTDECWEWTAGKNSKGYGVTSVFVGSKLKQIYAHRAAWVIAGKRLRDGVCILHKCDNPACVRRSHHFLGTKGDNNRDTKSKGRDRKAMGEAHGQSKLTIAKVREIRRRRDARESLSSLARAFGVCNATIINIERRKTWRHVA
jgi:DNA-binding XRE family transcriptional regulator